MCVVTDNILQKHTKKAQYHTCHTYTKTRYLGVLAATYDIMLHLRTYNLQPIVATMTFIEISPLKLYTIEPIIRFIDLDDCVFLRPQYDH